MGCGRFSLVLVAAPLAYGWLVLLNHLRLEWTVNAAYNYGYAVPFLCLYLVWEEIRGARTLGLGPADATPPMRMGQPGTAQLHADCSGRRSAGLLAVVLAALWFPTRLLQEANPQWRLTSWLLAIEVIGLSLAVVYYIGGEVWFRRLAFPIGFGFVAVPWPTVIERPLILSLTGLNATVVTELLGWAGYPALRRGSIIEIASGVVGLDEACSGIRSFQASLMISLFLGQLYRLRVPLRLAFCLAGFVLAMGFNFVRTFILALVAVRQGVPAIAQWHEPAGFGILGGCLLVLWLLALVLARQKAAPSSLQTDEAKSRLESALLGCRPSRLRVLAPAVCAWFLLSEFGVEAWYRSHETGLKKAPAWTISIPDEDPAFSRIPLPEGVRQTLRYDQAIRAVWAGPQETKWQLIYLRWLPGRVAAHLARGHTPELCLPASGKTVSSAPGLKWLEVHGLQLPFRTYRVRQSDFEFYVFYCLWEDRIDTQFLEMEDIVSWRSRFANVWAGRRNLGQRSLEIALWGIDDPVEAEKALTAQLKRLIRVEP